GAADLFDAGAAGPAAGRGRPRPLRRPEGGIPPHRLAAGPAGRHGRIGPGLRPRARLLPRARFAGRRQDPADRQPDPAAVPLVAQLAVRCRAVDRHHRRHPGRAAAADAPDKDAGAAAMTVSTVAAPLPARRARGRPFDWRRTPGLGSYVALMVAFL